MNGIATSARALTGTAALQFRDALDTLSDAGWMGVLLDDWRGMAPTATWRCEYARRHRSGERWAQCVFAADDGCRMCVDALCSADGANLLHPALGPLRITAFPDDAALPGLGEVIAKLQRAQIVRYRPGVRCTLRGFVTDGERFVKVSPKGERLYDDAVKLWRAYREGAFSVGVAEPHGWHAPTCSFWQGVVPGRPVVHDLFAADGENMARRLGAALGELSVSGVAPSLTVSAADHLRRTTHTLARATRLLPGLEPRLAQVRTTLEGLHAALPVRHALVPVHGSPHMHQWLEIGRAHV